MKQKIQLLLISSIAVLGCCISSYFFFNTINSLDTLCGQWESVEKQPDIQIYKEGKTYKLTIAERKIAGHTLPPETYTIIHENDNLYFHTGFRIDISYDKKRDLLTFSPNGVYKRVTENNKQKFK